MADASVPRDLTGEARRQVAAELWTSTQPGGRVAALITGVSGVGKSDRLVRPFLNRARAEQRIALHIDVPESPLSIDAELSALVINDLRDIGQIDLASVCEGLAGFTAVARQVLRQGALIVIDEFQRLLEPGTGLPVDDWRERFRKLAVRAADGGCLWLVSNREIAPEWSEPFHVALLPPPSQDGDQVGIVIEALGGGDADLRFPVARRGEVVRRLGGNPRALRLLGMLLRTHALEDMLGPAQATPDGPADPALVSKLELQMVARAAEGLTPRPRQLLELLTVLPDPSPWALVEAVAGTPRDAAIEDAADLQSRYLLDARGSRYAVHPVVREVMGPHLRAHADNWTHANLRAGQWHAQALRLAMNRSLRDADLALRLSGVRYHLLSAGAHEELKAALEPVQGYVEARFGWSGAKLTATVERDGAIALLSSFLESPGDPGVEFTYAKLLWARDLPGDAERALPHAERSTVGQDFSVPWVLWLKLIREVEGLEAAVAAAPRALNAVAAHKSLYSVYQFHGACLAHLGKVEAAVETLLKGAEVSKGNEQRLMEEAVLVAAASADDSHLARVRDAIAAKGSKFLPALALTDVLLLERQGRWKMAADLAERSRIDFPTHIHLANHEALARLGAQDPAGAIAALRRFPWEFRPESRNGNQWLLSLVSAQAEDGEGASRHYGIYTGTTQAPGTVAAIKAALLREWDLRVGTVGEANPALIAPILPAAVTGLTSDVRRPQFGAPVLPQHSSPVGGAKTDSKRGLAVLAIATEWQSGRGGLSTLNRTLCHALAGQGARVICVVEPGSGQAFEDAGVQVVVARATPGLDPRDALQRLPELPAGFTPDLIIGHGRVTGPAAKVLAEDHFPAAKRLHFVHMAPDEIEWLKPGRQDDAAMRADDRTRMEVDLARGAARVVAVGPRLHGRYMRDLQAERLAAPLRLDPGFEVGSLEERQPPDGRPWAVLTMGRLEDDELKGLDIAASAMGRVATGRRVPESLELIVRGAPEGKGEETRTKVREWAASSELSVLVRPYTVNVDRLEADLRRASLVLMPSRSEGFGLVGLEAILAGTPVLVSDQSGLGELLQEVLSKEVAARHVVRVTGELAVDGEVWSRAVEAILLDREASFRRAAQLRSQLSALRTWPSAISALLTELAEFG